MRGENWLLVLEIERHGRFEDIAMSRKENNIAIPSVRSLIEAVRKDPEYMAKHAERERQRDAHAEEFAHLSAPVLSELAAAGFDFSSIDDLKRSGMRYQMAIPILIKWLPLLQNRGLKESIVRALSVPWAKPAAALPLIAEFKNADWYGNDSLKWAIGNGLSIVADDTVFDGWVEDWRGVPKVQPSRCSPFPLGVPQ
jgi:hypothetical protein